MRARSCPDHPDAMEALYVRAPDDASELEIDRCGECGALWFDAGELELVANLHARPAGAESEHPCPACGQQLVGATLRHGLFAHRCPHCRGTFLDAATVRKLGSDRLPRPPDAQAKLEASVGFICAKCSGRFPYAQGNATSKGLVCPRCVVNPQPERLRGGSTSTYRMPGPHRGAAGLDFDLFDAIDSIADLFRR